MPGERLVRILELFKVRADGSGATPLCEVCAEAIRVCRMLELLIRQTQTDVPPAQYAEVLGLLALLLLHHSRRMARVGSHGELILLSDQERSLWDKRAIQEGLALVEKALYMRQIGPYQIQSAISALHARAPTAAATDWPQIAALYVELRRHGDSAIIQLNHAVAVSMADGPQVGLQLLEPLADALSAFAPFHLARADMLHRTDQVELARAAYHSALDLTLNTVERDFILQRIASLGAR